MKSDSKFRKIKCYQSYNSHEIKMKIQKIVNGHSYILSISFMYIHVGKLVIRFLHKDSL